MTDEETIEKEAKEKVDELFNELCLWLNKAEKDYKVEMWLDGEGRSISVMGIEINFSDNGYVGFEGEETA